MKVLEKIIKYNMGDPEEVHEYKSGDTVEVEFSSSATYYLEDNRGVIHCNSFSVYTTGANSKLEIMALLHDNKGNGIATLYFDPNKTYEFVVKSSSYVKNIMVLFRPKN